MASRISRRLDARAAAGLRTLTLLILLAAAGVVSEVFLHARADLTRDREFTLSPAALSAVEGLRDNVTIRVVMSKDLPPEFARIRTRVVDLLREFEARSGGRIDLVFEDPTRDSAARIAALSLGIEETVFEQTTRDGVRAKKGFFGLALLYRDEKEYFPVLRSIETFEYDLVVRLKKLTGSTGILGVVEDGGNGLEFSILKSRIEPLYTLAPQSPADSAIGPQVDLLLVAAPARLGEIEKRRIDEYLMRGKPVLFLAPGARIDFSAGMEASPTDDGYEDFLAHYGIGIGKNLLVDPSHWERVRFGDAELPIPYPYWITVSPATLNADNPVTASLPALSFPWPSAISVDPTAQPAARYEVLAATSTRAWADSLPAASGLHSGQGEDMRLYPRPLNAYLPGAQKSFPLVVAATGPMTSFYTPGAIADVKLLVASNALFASDFYADYVDIESNLQLVLNALDQFLLDPELIGLRSRKLPDVSFDPGRAHRAKAPLLGVNMVVGPLLVLVLAGLLAWGKRKRSVS